MEIFAPSAEDGPHRYARLAADVALGAKISKKERRCLYARSAAAARVVYLTPAAAPCVEKGSKLRVVHAGATVFRRKRKQATHVATPEARGLLDVGA